MTATAMPLVSECTIGSCSFNHEQGCHAFAVTIADRGCTTFIPLATVGGTDRVTATVGACQRADCVSNEHLFCTAEAIRVGAGDDPADCLTFASRA